MRRDRGLFAYGVVTLAYWSFMLTDGALRMLVLLHFHILGFSPLQLAWLFVLYEIAGMATNLTAGWIAARVGLTATLYAGLSLQVLALVALAALDPGWAIGASVAYVMAVQGVSGIAKDLAKMSAKSAVKHLAPAEDGGLFRWVAALTGSKNAVKGVGFFLGAAALGLFGFAASVLGMAVVLGAVLILAVAVMPAGLSAGRKDAKFREVFSGDANVNRLSLARVFLFGARDVWFVVGVPIYFHAVLSDGTPDGNRDAFFLVGGFMAAWIILYGAVQAAAPALLGARRRPTGDLVRAARTWVAGLALVPLALAALAWAAGGPAPWLTAVLVAGLLAFGFLFAVNSSLHSYLILAFTRGDRVTMDVGFYYMANAAGRLLGTVLSGLSYQWGGLPLCLLTAALMLAASRLAAGRLSAPGSAQSAP